MGVGEWCEREGGVEVEGRPRLRAVSLGERRTGAVVGEADEAGVEGGVPEG